jgi:hypothetical protein
MAARSSRNGLLLAGMDLIMADSTDGNQVFHLIRTAMSMVFNMMQFKMTRISRIPFGVIPAALSAGVRVSNKHRPSHRISN